MHSLPWTVRLPYIFLPAAPADTGIAHRNSLRISLLKQVVQVCLFDNDDHTALRDSIAQSYLLINATSVGMVPDIDDTIIKDTSLFHPELVVADVVYEPQETRLLREAKAAGCQTFNGMYMLLHQGG